MRPGGGAVCEWPEVVLVPDDGFLARFRTFPPRGGHDDPVMVLLDVSTTPTVDPAGPVSAIDLDWDIVRFRSGRTIVQDQRDDHEFDADGDSLKFPADVAAQAEGAARRLYKAVAQGDEPFGRASESWLAVLSEAARDHK